MSRVVQIPVQVVDIRPRKDKSWRMAFETRELTGEEVDILASSFLGEGWLQFSANEDLPAPPESPADAGVKSPAERLRNHIYAYWQQQGAKGNFNNYYGAYMDKLCEMIREKMDGA